MKGNHSPIPWGIHGADQCIILTEAHGQHLGEVITKTDTGCFFQMPMDTRKANAEIIVTAVNHHQELITRLYNLKNAIEVKDQALIDLYLYDANKTLSKLIP